MTAKEILNFADKMGRAFSIKDLQEFFKNTPTIRLYKHLYRMVNQGKLKRIERGKYEMTGKDEKNIIESEISILNDILKKRFPYIRYSLFSGEWLASFMQHIAINHSILIDVDKEAVESVFYFLQKEYNPIFLNPDNKTMDLYVNLKEKVFIVRTLVSEAPLFKVQDIPVPAIEKILVDIISDAVFYYLRGSETFNVYKNVFEQYPININRLLRYARRRNREKDVLNILKENNINI